MSEDSDYTSHVPIYRRTEGTSDPAPTAEPPAAPPSEPADVCRANGWGPGTRLVGDEGYGPTVIELRYIGERCIVAKAISHNGNPVNRRESMWTLACRDWRVVDSAPPAAPEEDRTAAHLRAHEPPTGYEVYEDETAHEPEVGLFGSLWWPLVKFEPQGAYASRTEAVAACWAHHDAITAPLRAEFARKQKHLENADGQRAHWKGEAEGAQGNAAAAPAELRSELNPE